MPESKQCPNCKNFHGLNTCKAFPDGIPEEILSGQFDHSEKWPDQENNILFDPSERNVLDMLEE